MAHRLLDPDAEPQRTSCESVENIHKVSVVRRQPPVSVFALKVGSGWIEPFGWRKAATAKRKINNSNKKICL